MRSLLRCAFGWLALTAGCSVHAHPGSGAGWDQPVAPDRTRWLIAWDNDVFLGRDRDYTQGLTLGRETGFEQDGVWTSVRWSVGQALYTPAERRDVLIPGERPFAGWVYLSRARSDEGARWAREETTTLGWVGPSAAGRQTQNAIHGALGMERFEGWHRQLRDEPTLSWEGRERRALALSRQGRADLWADGHVLLGTHDRSIGLALTGRWGPRVPSDSGPRSTKPGRSNYGFASVDLQAVGRSLPLSGNRWSHRAPSVDERVGVVDASLGWVWATDRHRFSAVAHVGSRRYADQPAAPRYLGLEWAVVR